MERSRITRLVSRAVLDARAFRSEFPVLERLAYLNAGANGPVPRAAIDAVAADLRAQAERGRGDPAFFEERMLRPAEALRGRVASLLGCSADELAFTSSTTGGVNTVLAALELGPGDEVLTSDEEHPGVLAPLAAGRARRGFQVRSVPFAEVAGEVGPRTRLVAVSHVSWVTGRVIDSGALRASGSPVLLDGAQGLGALPVDMRALGCDFYAASGQKWLCGPLGAGYLFTRGELLPELLPPAAGYQSLADASRPLELALHEDARRLDAGPLSSQDLAWALAALDVLERPALAAVQERAAGLAARLAGRLAELGKEVAPRGESTLVSWRADDPEAEAARLREEDIVVRHLPGRPWVRASVGAWSSEEELDRLATSTSSR
jgi:selenocysteine lyase/cysteine desulfurase